MQRSNQTVVVARVQAYRRLIQDIEHAHQPRADLRRQPNPLRLSARQRPGRTIEGQVVQADVDQELQTLADLLEDAVGDLALAGRERSLVAAQAADPGEGGRHRPGGDVDDVEPVDRHRQRLGAQALAPTARTRPLGHVFLDLGADVLGLRLLVATFQVPNDAFVGGAEGRPASVPTYIAHRDLFAIGAVQKEFQLGGGEGLDRRFQVDVVMVGDGLDHLPVVALLLATLVRPFEGDHGAIGDRQAAIGNDPIGVDLQLDAEPLAFGASPMRGVEGKGAGFELGQRRAVLRASQLLGEGDIDGRGLARGLVPVAVELGDDHPAVSQTQRRLDRIRQAGAEGLPILAGLVLDDEAVDHGLDRVGLVAVELDLLIDALDVTVDAHPGEPGAADLLEDGLVGPFPAAHQGRQDEHAGAGRQFLHGFDDLLGRLLPHLAAADRAMRHADASEQQTQVIVDFRDRADGRARVVRNALLVDRYGRGQAVDVVDIGLVQLAEELACVGGKRLDVAPLPFGEDRVEGQRRLARPGDSRDHDQPVARDLQVDVFQIVLACANNDDLVLGHVGAAPDDV